MNVRVGRARNLLHSVLLIGGMLLLLCVIGQMFWGLRGLVFLGALGGLFLVLSPRLSPRLILRMYRARPLSTHDAPWLVGAVEQLARRARLPAVPRLHYVPSQVVNAFAVGSRGSAAIGVTDGMLRTLNKRELTGVLAHEMSHVRSNDIWVMGLADLISRSTNTLSFLGQFLLLINLPFVMMGQQVVPWGAVILLILAPTVNSMLQLALSRSREYDADLGAVALTGDPRGLASALAKLGRLNAGLFERIFLPGRRIPDPSLLRSHPRTEDRIQRLLELEGQPVPAGPVPQALRERSFADVDWVPVRAVRVPRWHVSGLWY